MSNNKLGSFLAEVSNWQWDEFVRAELDSEYTSNQAIIFGLIRSCYMQKFDAIKLSINRLDGKLKTPIKIETPKIYYLYPNATSVEGAKEQPKLRGETFDKIEVREEVTAPVPEPEPTKEDLPSMGFRETLSKMSDYPRQLPVAILKLAEQVEGHVRGKAEKMPDEVPLVKSVVAASLLVMAQNRNMDALYEVFDQIDGKLVETIQIVGQDMYLTDYSLTAPPGAKPNKDGILQIEATNAQQLWAKKLTDKVTQ